MDNGQQYMPFSQQEIHKELERLSQKYGKDRKELFRPLLLSRKFLTTVVDLSKIEEWKLQIKELNEFLDVDDRDIICKVLAIIYYKYEPNTIYPAKPTADDLLKETGVDDVTFHGYYYNDDMRQYAQISKDIELLDRKIQSLVKLAEDNQVRPYTRIQAWKEITSHIEKRMAASASYINVYTGQALIANNSGNKTINGVDITKLMGQGDKEFRSKIKELDEIQTIENGTN